MRYGKKKTVDTIVMKKRDKVSYIAIHVGRDALVFLVSLAFAYLIIDANLIHRAVEFLGPWSVVAILIVGFFFTSVLTVAPAAVALGEFSQDMPLLLVAGVGALGSVLADLIIFRLFRDHVADDIRALLYAGGVRKLSTLRRSKLMRRTLSVLGALIIASPFPDEIGIALMGASRMKPQTFIMVAYAMNALGILLVGLAARAI